MVERDQFGVRRKGSRASERETSDKWRVWARKFVVGERFVPTSKSRLSVMVPTQKVAPPQSRTMHRKSKPIYTEAD